MILTLVCACSSDDGEPGPMPDAGGSVDAAPATVDATTQTFPAVCQELPLSCPNATALSACEAGSGTAYGLCSFLPITLGCASGGCPSDAQICRTAESSAGHCTHACVDNDDCSYPGGSATCTMINPGLKICIVN